MPGTPEERRHEDRRHDDVRLSEEVAELRHMLESGEHYAEKEHGHREIYRLIEVLEGKSTLMPSGRTIYEGGLINEVAQLTKAMRNGGFKIKIPVMGWVAIIAAIIAGLFNVWAALVTTMPWG